MEVSISLEEMKEGKDERHKALAHSPVLWFKFQSLRLRIPEKYFLSSLARYHGRKLECDMKAMPYATKIMQADFRRVR